MLALDLRQVVTEAGAEVFVCLQDRTIWEKFDDSLRAADGGKLCGVLGCLDFRCGYIGCELDDLVGLAAARNRVVGGLDPDLAAGLGDPLIFFGVEISGCKIGPESLVFGRCHIVRFAEDAVVFSLDLCKRITQRFAEIGIGV
ncbi:hypothetical protein D3C80_375580 [compost metagenome]